jgi:hypothetical protein
MDEFDSFRDKQTRKFKPGWIAHESKRKIIV